MAKLSSLTGADIPKYGYLYYFSKNAVYVRRKALPNFVALEEVLHPATVDKFGGGSLNARV